ncbi:MAG: OmpA family protein [Paludibacteraceae bacterium]|nr:OmpA family protein [Paludibacteraceae bacterium]
MKRIVYLCVFAAIATSCVTQAKYNAARDAEAQYYDEARTCRKEKTALENKNKELEAELKKLRAKNEKAQEDTAMLSRELRRVQDECEAMQRQNLALFERLQAPQGNEEAQALLAEIQGLQTELMKREDALFQAERALYDKQREVEIQNDRIIQLTEALEAQERKLAELRDKVRNALVGFEGNGLAVTTRGGRIYVSMEEQLLFESGKWDVANRGRQALAQLATVLAANKDVEILIEGHTDNIPFSGNGNIEDNWDLSVKRATAIVKILCQNSEIDARRVVASGRADNLPVDTSDTSEGRSRNRRCEIILSPNLDELVKLFD